MLDIFTDLNIDNDKLHYKYVLLKNNQNLMEECSIIKDWVTGFIDRDNKIIKEFQTTFHSSFWEFFLFAFLKEAELEVDFKHNRPDFIICAPNKFYIEAVVANIKKGGRQECERTIEDVLSMVEPYSLQENFDENFIDSILRYSSSFVFKSDKYKNYSSLNYFDRELPYVIALSGYENINYGRNFYFAMLALLYGEYFDNLNEIFLKKEKILKPETKTEIQIGLFLDEKFSHISAVIFSCTVTLGKLTSLAISKNKVKNSLNSVLCIRHSMNVPHFNMHIVSPSSPENLSDGVFIFHNPRAKNPLPIECFNKTNAVNVFYNADSREISFDGKNCPIVSRLNVPVPESGLKMVLPVIFESFNPHLLGIIAQVDAIEESYDSDGFDVKFVEISDDPLDFVMTFTDEAIKTYNVKENNKYFFVFNIPQYLHIKTIEQFIIYKKFKRARFLIGERELVLFKEVEGDFF
ncbi:hypothetical protein IG626_02150 [Desulfovibrio desulfuricans]|uniref:hypothetical protein n=1 Tax=Desulfovibrio desulfuricans TaxID=876 RepID=UPI00177FD3CE|nr:hypothetical protein [Desulfovibrio desulfuricans]MBD8894792.1 hypothetical protein [Desulfovibrio desulfuricans]